MSMCVMTVTPSMASDWLAASPRNFRKLSRETMLVYARDMKNGSWKLNGETIKLGLNGEVLDGQTRLAACVHAGVPFRTYVVTGIEDDVAIDCGRNRSLSQHLSSKGLANTSARAGLVNALMRHDRGAFMLLRNRGSVSECLDYHAAHQDVVEDAVRMCAKAKGLINPSTLGAIVVVGTRTNFKLPSDSAIACYFVHSLLSGEELSKDNAIYHLRERQLATRGSKSRRFTDEYEAALAVIAWNKTVRGEPCRRLAWRTKGATEEAFPAILPAPAGIVSEELRLKITDYLMRKAAM